ncbi:MAG TPA: heparinase II/III family protein, partial [Verrucomicrobiae bacterium]|nr:heparinase II/III family protein [Verrucomicrobiae bacterium]
MRVKSFTPTRSWWLFTTGPRTVFAFAYLLISITSRAQTNLPPHPRLLLDGNGIAALKKRIAVAPWAAASWNELKARADRDLKKAVVLPPRGGNWSHNYVCPEHGARLKLGKQIGPWQWEHICPVGDHVLHGDPTKATLDFDGNAISSIHGDYAREIVDDGLVYQVTGDARYAAHAREILLAYADRYLTYPVHDNQGKPGGRGGHVASQSLTEATWLIDVAQGADLVWDTLSEADRSAIVDKMLRPALDEIIIPQKYGIHNIQCREDSAIGLVGFLLNDPKLISLAIDDPKYGFRAQMEHGVLPGGFWLEGSTGYHFFAMDGMWPLMEAARNCGTDLYGPKFKSLFDGPLALAMPNLSLPNFNDSGISPLEGHAEIYELAVARYQDPVYAALLPKKRSSRMALLFGSTNVGGGNVKIPVASRNLTGPGYAILERGKDEDATWLGLKYGPHGGGHGHPDKNSFILYARGEIVAPDVGTHAYGSPLHTGWDKTTLAHNTLVVDEKSQAPAQGKCLAFGSEQGVDFSVTDAGPIYPGVHFIRTAATLTTNLIVFIDQIDADAPHTFDLAYHQVGSWENLPAGQPWSSKKGDGYKYFADANIRDANAGDIALITKISDNWKPVVTLAESSPTEVITGYGIWKTTEDRVPMVVQRRHAQQTTYVWAVSLDGGSV